MGIFDGLSQYLADPQNAAQIRGALIGASQAIGQPYGNIGSAATGAAMGAQTGLQNYQQKQMQNLDVQSKQLGLANDKFGMQQKLGGVNFLRNLQGQVPLTLDDVLKGNFGTQGGAVKAPMSPPITAQAPATQPPIDPGFSVNDGKPPVDPGFAVPSNPNVPAIDPGFSRQSMGVPTAVAPQISALAPPGSSMPSLPRTMSRPQVAPQPQPVPAAPILSAPQPATASQSPPASSIIPPDLMANPVFKAALQSGDSGTVMSMLTKHQTQLTPDELKLANLPSDSLAFKAPDGTIDIKRTGTIKSPEEIDAEVKEEQAKGLKSKAQIEQELYLKRSEAGIVAPSVDNSIVLPLMRKMLSGSALSPTEQAVLSVAKPTAALGPQGLQPTDNKSTSLIAQTGLSQAALDWLTKGARPRGQQQYNAIQQEIGDFSRKTGVDTATLEAQAKGYNNILTNNLQRNNQGKILENEIQGSVQNVAPLADAIGSGKISALNLANIWAGKQINDPTTLQYKDQLVRLQHELAGYNAVAGGKLTENGTPRVDQSDLDSAANTITQGINSGGLRGLAASIGTSTAKNKAVLGSAIDDANQGMWNLFGVGQNYQRQSPGIGGAPPPLPPSKVDPNIQKQITPANLQATALRKGVTVDKVKQQLRSAGYQVP